MAKKKGGRAVMKTLKKVMTSSLYATWHRHRYRHSQIDKMTYDCG
jgi:hypothetical protein